MKTKKPDIFLGITMCMLVLAAVLCIVILWVQKSENNPKPSDPALDSGNVSQTGETPHTNTDSTNSTNVTPSTDPVTNIEVKQIDSEKLQAALDESLRGLTSEWQVMVIDPANDTRVGSAVNCGVDDWMTANRMTQVYIMATVFQQAQDGTLVLDDVLDDVKAMITANDTYAADRLTEKLGDGNAAAGREKVKTFAVDNGTKLGFNRPLTGNDKAKNYVTAQKTAELLNLLCAGKLVSEAASKQMLDILLTPVESPEIDTGLTGDGVRFGFIHDVEEKTCICSMGVVQLQNRNYVVSVVCNKPVTTEGAKKKVTELISMTLPYFAE